MRDGKARYKYYNSVILIRGKINASLLFTAILFIMEVSNLNFNSIPFVKCLFCAHLLWLEKM